MNETWKRSPDFPDYEVSDAGRIKNRRAGLILKHQIQNSGYYLVHIRKNHRRRAITIHRLVLMTFIGHPQEGMQCDHINGNKLDNRLVNLHWVTGEDNMRNNATKAKMSQHSAKNLLGCFGEKHPMSKRIFCVELQQTFGSILEASRMTKIDSTSISNVCRGVRQKRAGGYRWQYAT